MAASLNNYNENEIHKPTNCNGSYEKIHHELTNSLIHSQSPVLEKATTGADTQEPSTGPYLEPHYSVK
jgi:hypothetical protein